MKKETNDLKQRGKDLKNAYQREWRKKNLLKAKKNQENYWQRKAASLTDEEKAVESLKKAINPQSKK